MKGAFNVVLWSYLVTLLLYATIILGMLAQVALGAIHLLSAIYVYTRYRALEKGHRISLNIYSFLVVIYFVGLSTLDNWSSRTDDTIRMTYLFVIPMLIGAYYVALVYQFRNIDKKPVKIDNMDILEEDV